MKLTRGRLGLTGEETCTKRGSHKNPQICQQTKQNVTITATLPCGPDRATAAAQATEEGKTKESKKQSFPTVSSNQLNHNGETVPPTADPRGLLDNPVLCSESSVLPKPCAVAGGEVHGI